MTKIKEYLMSKRCLSSLCLFGRSGQMHNGPCRCLPDDVPSLRVLIRSLIADIRDIAESP